MNDKTKIKVETKDCVSSPVENFVSLRGTTLRKFKSKYRCVCNPTKHKHKIKMYDFNRRKYYLKEFHGIGIGGCCLCNTFNNCEKLYLVNGFVAHESCAMKIINASDESN